MDYYNYYDVVKRTIVDYGFSVDEEEMHPTRTMTELGLDSLDTVELIAILEGEFNIKMNDAEVGNANTLQDLADLCRREATR